MDHRILTDEWREQRYNQRANDGQGHSYFKKSQTL